METRKLITSLKLIHSQSTDQARMTLAESTPLWRTDVMHQLQELVHLQSGWDGYQGHPVANENAAFALGILQATCRESTPPPQIVPGPAGDLQIEWHTLRGDVELLVCGPNKVRAWYCLAPNDDGEEVELTNNFVDVAEWIKEVTETEFAVPAAA